MIKKIGKYILNCLLGLIMCVPIITIADAITAMHFVNFKLVDDPDTNVCREFFKSFKQNFVQSLVFLVILGGIAALFGYLWVGLLSAEGEKSFVLMGFLFIVTTIYFNFESLSTYFLAKFENTSKRLMLLAFYAGSKNLEPMLKCSLLEAAMIAVPAFIYAVNPGAVSLLLGLFVFFVLMVIFEMLSAKTINPIMLGLIKREEEAKEQARLQEEAKLLEQGQEE